VSDPRPPHPDPSWRFGALALAWACLVLFANGLPAADLPGFGGRIWKPPHVDKLAHAIQYSFFALFLCAFWGRPDGVGRTPVRFPVLATTLMAACMGAMDELRQLAVPGRSADIWDWATDVAAALLVAAMFQVAARGMARGVRPGLRSPSRLRTIRAVHEPPISEFPGEPA
jgi:VanZ family protein